MHAQCLCGEVAWEADGPLAHVHHCHCARCRKFHGTGYASYGAVPADAFRWLRGEPAICRYESSPGFFRCFCGGCGSVVPGAPQQGLVFVPIGPAEGDFKAVVEGHIFAASRAPWMEISDGLPAADAFPPDYDIPSQPDLERPAAGGEQACNGSCLCGGVAWRSRGAFELLRHCHCLRCRRGRSAAHASNGFVSPEHFEWLRGEAEVVLYKLPGAKRFSQAFCRACGAKVPWRIPGFERMNIPLGGLDDDPGARPSEHIFVASKAPWFEITDALAQHAEYPPG